MPSRAVERRNDRYRLRPLAIKDWQTIAEFYQHKSFWMHLMEGALSESRARDFINQKVTLTNDPEGREVWWTVEDAKSESVIGTANLKFLDKLQERKGSAGCALAPGAQGHGLGPRLGWDMIALGFEHFALELIECSCAEDNERSAHTMCDTFQMAYQELRETPRDGAQGLWREHIFSIKKETYLATTKNVEVRLQKG